MQQTLLSARDKNIWLWKSWTKGREVNVSSSTIHSNSFWWSKLYHFPGFNRRLRASGPSELNRMGSDSVYFLLDDKPFWIVQARLFFFKPKTGVEGIHICVMKCKSGYSLCYKYISSRTSKPLSSIFKRTVSPQIPENKSIPCRPMASVNDGRQMMMYWFNTKNAMKISFLENILPWAELYCIQSYRL